VRADLKLFHRFFVDVRRTIHGELLDQRRQREIGPAHARTGAFAVSTIFDRRLIEHSMIERFQANPNFLSFRHYFFSF